LGQDEVKGVQKVTAEQFGLLEQEEDTMLGQYLTFAVGQEIYGIAIKYVTEIIGIQPISTLPEVPAFIKGIINLRGKIIPVIDMRLKFNKVASEYTDRTCIIVVDVDGELAGFIVDSVEEVMTIDDENISSPPDFSHGAGSRYISGIGKIGENVKLLLNCEMLLNVEDAYTVGSIK
jgi:purine-binding chemotaxis protein CheW